ncbi:hypothetical protein lerEdw1_002194 [Lerista edwardsae]|nr:hypothetical protein lerEdw1_002194 [Lerista edwardsae]
MVESREMAKNVSVTTMPDVSLVPPLDSAINSFANNNVLEESSTPVQKDDHFEMTATSQFMPSEALKMHVVSSQPNQEQNDGHSAQHSNLPDPPSEQLKADNTSIPLAHGEDGGHLEAHSKTPGAPPDSSEQLVQGEESRSEHCHDKDPDASTNLLKPLGSLDTPSELGQEEKGSPLVHHRDTSDQQESANTSSQLGMPEDSCIVDCHGQPPVVLSESPEQAESVSSPAQAICNAENTQASYGTTVASSNSPCLLLLEANTPSQPQGGDGSVFPGHHLSSAPFAESKGTLNVGNVSEDVKPSCQERSETGEEKKDPSGQDHPSLAAEKDLGSLNGQFWREDLLGDSQATEEQVSQGTNCTSDAPSQALADPLADVEACSQQRAADTGSDTASEAVPALSPVATGDSCGPAHRGLAPVCDGQNREGLAVHESSEASDTKPQTEVEAKAVLESEKGEKGTRNAEPEETTREPQRANKDPAGVAVLARETPELDILTSTSDPSGPKDPASAMVLAGAEDPCGARDPGDSQAMDSAGYPVAATEQTGDTPKPREGLLIHAEDQATPEHLVSAADPDCATPVPDEPSEASGSGCPPDWTEDAAGTPETPTPVIETPIEREIRLHLEREELLRRERGLANSRVTPEYVEVRIRPILNQSLSSSPLPKEKERQWAGAQMQREIQRECRREDDLVQLGKVRGAYDRGTPQEMQEKKMLFEQHPGLEPPAPRKIASSGMEGMKGPSFAEANCTANVVILDSGALLRSQGPTPERTRVANPFFCLRANSPQSLLEQEVQEAQERERELQRQRYNLYGSALTYQSAATSDLEEEPPTPPERPSCKKLDFTWPPPSNSETSQVNGLHQRRPFDLMQVCFVNRRRLLLILSIFLSVPSIHSTPQMERSPRIFRRQKSALIQRWESGAVGNQESED